MPAAAADTPNHSGTPELTLLLRGPQLWWAYLAVLSNPLFQGFAGYDRVLCTDSVSTLQEQLERRNARTKHLLLFWDGIQAREALPEGLPELCRDHGVTALVVGTNQCSDFPDVRPLYAEGAFHFSSKGIRFDADTAARIRKAKLRNLLTPARNLLKRSGSAQEAFRLLAGKRQLVFCGGYGLNEKIVGMLNNRYGAAPAAMLQHTWSAQKPLGSAELLMEHLREDFTTLRTSFAQGLLAPDYFVAAVRLVNRGYLLQQIRLANLPLYTNQFSQHFIDVYSTPFYRQHVFLDFGSTISAANYPRLADLSYYRKRTLRVDLPHEAPSIAATIASGVHESVLASKWQALHQQITQVM